MFNIRRVVERHSLVNSRQSLVSGVDVEQVQGIPRVLIRFCLSGLLRMTFVMGGISGGSSGSMDLTEAEDIKKRWQEYTEELTKKIFTTQIITMV